MKLGQSYKLKKERCTIIGIDSYNLSNLLGKSKTWKSYTFQNQKGEKRWVVTGIMKKTWICHAILKKDIPKNLIVLKEYSGTAKITFKGNKGFSSPKSKITLWKEKTKVYCKEQFFHKDKIKAYYFIARPASISNQII